MVFPSKSLQGIGLHGQRYIVCSATEEGRWFIRGDNASFVSADSWQTPTSVVSKRNVMEHQLANKSYS
jgi:hypothetical protein